MHVEHDPQDDRKRALASVVALFMVLTAGGYRLSTGNWPLQSSTQRNAEVQLELNNDQPRATTLEQVRDFFGPWDIQTEVDPGVTDLLVMLRESGAVDVSTKHVDFQPQEWSASRPFTLQTSVDGDRVIVETDERKTFSVAFEQPFIVEQTPEDVYLVTSDGTVWTTPTEDLRVNPDSESTP